MKEEKKTKKGLFDSTTSTEVILVDINASLEPNRFAFETPIVGKIAQSIEEPKALSFDKIRIKLKKSGSRLDNVKVSIQGNSFTNTPNGIEFANAIISSDKITGIMTQYTLTLNTKVNLNANEKFWVVIEATDIPNANNYYLLAHENTNPYLSGSEYNFINNVWVAQVVPLSGSGGGGGIVVGGVGGELVGGTGIAGIGVSSLQYDIDLELVKTGKSKLRDPKQIF